jgi:hypothetical protein
MAVRFEENLTVDLDGSFRGNEHRIFEIKGSENSRNVKSQNFIWISMRSWPRSCGEKEKELHKGSKHSFGLIRRICMVSRH